ncbi:MAG TPA: hypothetical protein VKA34_05185, partial [Balneolales bacterium]|nr:hypothetical protein [Balneolales bacterium]
LLAVTDKVTTGPPHFVELEHHQPANISTGMERKIVDEVTQALNVLGIENGASHSEIFVTSNDEVIIGEIAGRMGGNLIGSDLVPYSTGYDFLKAVIEIALGEFKTGFPSVLMKEFSGAYFVSANPGIVTDIINRSGEYKEVVKAIPIVKRGQSVDGIIENSANRAGVIVYKSPDHRVPLCPSSVLKFITRKN